MMAWDIRSVVLIIAAIQAIVVSGMLLLRNQQKAKPSDTLLAFFLLALSATLSDHIAGWLNLYEGQRLTFFPFGHCFLFSPLAWLYIKSITNSQYKWSKTTFLHFVPAAVYFSVHLLVWAHPVDQKMQMIGWLARHHWFDLEGYGNIIVFSIYLYKIIHHYSAYIKWLPTEYSNVEKLQLRWIKNFIVLLGVYYLVHLGFDVSSLFGANGYELWFWQYFILAIIIYYISITGYAYVQKYALVFDLNIEEGSIEQPSPPELEATAKIGNDDKGFGKIQSQLLAHLELNKPYLEPELSLAQLAKQLNTPAYILTQVIKHNLNTNFNDLINTYRINAVIEKMRTGESKTKTLVGLAFDCGFNSKTTFHRAFKKATLLSPKAFADSI